MVNKKEDTYYRCYSANRILGDCWGWRFIARLNYDLVKKNSHVLKDDFFSQQKDNKKKKKMQNKCIFL